MPPKTRPRPGSASHSPVGSLVRKRRISIDDDDHNDKPDDGDSTSAAAPAAEDTTPVSRKVVKRVRFSDLGPELASTGLTPFVRRATLSPSDADQTPSSSRPVRRRRSLPPILPSSSADQSYAAVERIQFTPLRQVLDARVRRRLRRSHLSEEINDFQAEQRALSKAQSELTQLRDQEAHRQETIRQLNLDLEIQRQLGIEVNAEEEQRMLDLQRELADWKARVGNIKPEYDDNDDGFMDNAPDLPTNDNNFMEEIPTEPSSPWEEETFFSSPTSRRVVDMSSPLASSKLTSVSTPNHASCQAEIPDVRHQEQVQAFEEAVKRLTQESSDAKSALEMVKTELRNLGFAADNSPDEDIVSGLREAFRSARMQLEHLIPGETAGGTDQGSFLLTSLLAHLKKLVEAIKVDKKTIDRQQQIESALRGQFNATVQKASDLEERMTVIDSHRTNLIREIEAKDEELEEARREVEAQVVEVKKSEKQIAQLEAEAEEQCTSVNRLQAALVTYRDEVTSLESLVNNMESTNAHRDSELAQLRNQLHGAVTEKEATSQKLSKLQQDVQHSAFELSALAKPELKTNVTQRRPRRIDLGASAGKLSESSENKSSAESEKQSSGKGNESNQRNGGKRDSGVVMENEAILVTG